LRDTKADEPIAPLDPRVSLLLAECYRHAKAIGAWGEGVTALAAAGVPEDAPGVATAEEPATVLASLEGLLGAHRSWERLALPL
jgi:catalase